MFILSLSYVKPQEEADRLMEAHMDWVRQGYDSGMFLASGRKVPRTGGVILASGERADIEAFVADDPFAVHGVADYDITEVALTRTAVGLEGLKG
ncbi:MAG: YciI family protein [Hydrogenophaga sp.]|nr:YciI family protein [Hydrogenophaga sp.]